MLSYQSCMCFAVLNVIRAIFLHETFKVAGTDDDLMIMQKQRQIREQTDKIERFFYEADATRDGYISYDEFLNVFRTSGCAHGWELWIWTLRTQSLRIT